MPNSPQVIPAATPSPSAQSMSLPGLARRFMDTHEKMPDRKFAFVLGAGASRSSGIKTAGQMVADWVKTLYLEATGDVVGDGMKWATAATLQIENYDPNDPAAAYSELYERMYVNDPRLGYAYLEAEMQRAEPSLGYSVLARMMATTQHKVVITTNFDNLVADSLSIFSTTYPLVCGHESLAGFVRANAHRPLVVKVHRDLLLEPRSTLKDISELHEGFVEPLRELLRQYTPIVIGYGGNDGSLMSFLNGLAPKSIPGGVFWCYWQGGPPPSAAVTEFVTNQNGYFVPIPGFDEIMMLLGNHLSYPVPEKFLLERAKIRAERLVEQWDRLQGILIRISSEKAQPPSSETSPVALSQLALPTETAPTVAPSTIPIASASDKVSVNTELAKAILSTMQRADGERRWWQWDNLAKSEPDLDLRDQIYKEALNALPNVAPLLGNYANFLRNVRKDYDAAERMYKRALEADPKHANSLSNYANLLRIDRKDNDAAERMYKRALEADPKHSATFGNYATFLADVRNDFDAAEAMHKRALEADPNHATALGNYATFLANVRKDYDAAEAMHKRAIEADPTYANTLGNYAMFLANIRKDYDAADVMYKRALEADPNHANNLTNYANFLRVERIDFDAAEAMYKRAIEADPKHIATLCNYATFLTDIRKNNDAAEAMYTRALEVDPKNANALGSYATFLHRIRNEYSAAAAKYKQALVEDPKHVTTLCNYAIFLNRIQGDYDAAEAMYKRAIEADPKHAPTLYNYAMFLESIRKNYDAAEAIYKRTIEADPKSANTLGNYATFLTVIRKEHDAAGAMFKRALEADPKHPNNLCNYATFLTVIRKEHDAAEAMYKRAIEADPKRANTLANYANFLMVIRKNYVAAEAMYKSAIEADPKNIYTLSNYTCLLLSVARTAEGLELLDRAIASLDTSFPSAVNAECWMYAYCCRPHKDQPDALARLKHLVVQDGVRTGDWDFAGVIAQANKIGHAESAWLPKLAAVLAGSDSPASLDAWSAWANA